MNKFTKMGAIKRAIDDFYENAFSPEIVKILSFVESSEKERNLIVKYSGLEGSTEKTKTFEKTDSNTTFQVNLLKIRMSFEAALDGLKLDNNHIIFIDGIDVRPSDISYEDYFECVRGLIEAVWALNNDFLGNIKDSKGRIRVVLLVRPDIFLRTGLHNLNTKLRDNSVFLNWITTYKDYRSSLLFHVADRLLSAQQSEQMSKGSAWDYYFPFSTENIKSADSSTESKSSSFLSFLRFSYYRPRDINAMIGTLRDILSRRGVVDKVDVSDFSDPSFRDAHADYLLGEIRDQLLFYYSQDEFILFLDFFSHLNGKKKFSYKQFNEAFRSFISACSASGKSLPQFFESSDIFLQFLYEQNVICYIEEDDDGIDRDRFIRWCFRERTLSNLAPKVRSNVDYEIFYGLTKALNVGRPIRVRKEKAKREVGSIVRLNDQEKFGFIRGGADQDDYYFKYDQLEGSASAFHGGEKVSYEPKVKYGKLRAENIRRER